MKSTLLFFVFIALAFGALTEARAIPAFARQYSLSCQTCHSPVPRLKAYGDDFAGAGFVLSDKESPRYTQETGDNELSLIRNFPVAVRFDLAGSFNNAKSENGDLGTPYVLKFLSGGSLSKNIAYYFYFFFSERGEIAGVEDAYIMFNDLFGIDLDLYVGQFQISDPLFKREVRLTFEDYAIYKTKIGIANANLTYDRGLMMTLGLETGTDIIFEVVNGNGIGEADGNKIFDDDKHKTFVGRISQDVAEFFRLGGFIFAGNQDLNINPVQSTAETMMFGPDFTIGIGDILELNVQYVIRTDDKTLLKSDDIKESGKLETNGGFAELIFTPDGDKSSYYGAVLLNYIESDYKPQEYKSATAHLGYLLRRNIRLYGEYTYNKTYSYGEFGKFNIGIVSAF